MKSHLLSMLVAGGLLMAVTGCQSNTFTHAKFHERIPQLTNVVLLPPQIKTGTASNLCVVLQGPPLPAEAKFRAELPGLLAAAFRQQGLAVTGPATISQLPEATNQVGNKQLSDNLNAAYGNLFRPKAVRQDAIVLVNRVHADGLVFLSVFAYESSDGRKGWVAFNNLLAIIAAAGRAPTSWTPYSQAFVQIVLVDGKNGDVLWRTVHDFGSLEQKEPDHVVAELFKKYPKH